MNFYKYVTINYRKEDTPFGDLARDMEDDWKINESTSDDEIFKYLSQYTEVSEFVEELKREYLNNFAPLDVKEKQTLIEVKDFLNFIGECLEYEDEADITITTEDYEAIKRLLELYTKKEKK